MIKCKNLALIGKSRSGKDTVAEFLSNKYGYNLIKLGDQVRYELAELTSKDLSELTRAQFSAYAEACRGIDEDVWIDKVIEEIEILREYEGDVPVVVGDVRQLNEYKKLKELGFTFIRVQAGMDTRMEREGITDKNEMLKFLYQPAEKDTDSLSAHYTINNDSGLHELEQNLEEVMRYING